MEHNTNIKKANKFIGINTNSNFNYTNCNIIEIHVADEVNYSQIPSIYYTDKALKYSCNIIVMRLASEVHYSKTPSIYYTDEVIKYIRDSYFSSKKPVIDKIDIAIHIRRGDINKNSQRWLNNSLYLEIINKLKKKYPRYTITIFSEGTYKDFKDLGLEKKCFKLNKNIFKTFHSLVSSKVLIMGFSSFSYCAGIINKNTVYYYDDYRHKKLDHWLKISDLIGISNFEMFK
jgi:hypothetical protein